jgi:hypothetical protein
VVWQGSSGSTRRPYAVFRRSQAKRGRGAHWLPLSLASLDELAPQVLLLTYLIFLGPSEKKLVILYCASLRRIFLLSHPRTQKTSSLPREGIATLDPVTFAGEMSAVLHYVTVRVC